MRRGSAFVLGVALSLAGRARAEYIFAPTYGTVLTIRSRLTTNWKARGGRSGGRSRTRRPGARSVRRSPVKDLNSTSTAVRPRAPSDQRRQRGERGTPPATTRAATAGASVAAARIPGLSPLEPNSRTTAPTTRTVANDACAGPFGASMWRSPRAHPVPTTTRGVTAAPAAGTLLRARARHPGT